MRPDRDPDIFEDVVVLLHDRMVHWHAGIIDGLVDDAKRIGLRHPTEIVYSVRPVLLSAAVNFIDRAHLARFRLSKQIIVVKAPPSRRVAAERLARIRRISAGPRLYIHDTDFDDVTRLGAANKDWTGQDMHAEAFA